MKVRGTRTFEVGELGVLVLRLEQSLTQLVAPPPLQVELAVQLLHLDERSLDAHAAGLDLCARKEERHVVGRARMEERACDSNG